MITNSINLLKNTKREKFGNTIDALVFRIVRFVDLEKYVGEYAAHILWYNEGKDFGKELNFKSFDDIIKFCEDLKIGIVEVVNENPIQIRLDECITCSGLPNIGKPYCYFEAGFLAGCLESILGKKVHVKETHCHGLGNDFCQFEAKILE